MCLSWMQESLEKQNLGKEAAAGHTSLTHSIRNPINKTIHWHVGGEAKLAHGEVGVAQLCTVDVCMDAGRRALLILPDFRPCNLQQRQKYGLGLHRDIILCVACVSFRRAKAS